MQNRKKILNFVGEVLAALSFVPVILYGSYCWNSLHREPIKKSEEITIEGKVLNWGDYFDYEDRDYFKDRSQSAKGVKIRSILLHIDQVYGSDGALIETLNKDIEVRYLNRRDLNIRSPPPIYSAGGEVNLYSLQPERGRHRFLSGLDVSLKDVFTSDDITSIVIHADRYPNEVSYQKTF